MDEIHAPRQATLRTTREIHDDPEQQLELVPCRSRDQPRLHKFTVLQYTGLTSVPRLLAIFAPEMRLFNTQPPQLPLSVQKVVPNTLGPTLQSGGIRRRNLRANPTTESTRTENQKSEAAEGDPGKTFRFVVKDGPKLRHEKRTKELKEILEPVLGSDDPNSSSILLCWGKENRCHIVPVKIQDSADDIAIWHEIRRAWCAHRWGRRMRLALFRIQKVDIVKVLIAGQDKRKGGFIGTYTTEDVAAEKLRLGEIIANRPLPFQHPFDHCRYNPTTGEVDCSVSCASELLGKEECPEMKFRQAERRLSYLQMRPFLTLTFSDPDLAAGNDLLDVEGIVNSHKDILCKLRARHRPKLGELSFIALMIHPGLVPNSQHVVLLLGLALCFIVVISAELAFRDWGTAWNVGCFLVGLATLSWMWVTYTGD